MDKLLATSRIELAMRAVARRRVQRASDPQASNARPSATFMTPATLPQIYAASPTSRQPCICKRMVRSRPA